MYIYWIVIFLALPLILLWLSNRQILAENKKIFYKTLLGALLFGVPTDIIGTTLGVWFFPEKLIGIWFFGLPLEEFLFIFLGTMNLTYLTLWGLKKSSMTHD